MARNTRTFKDIDLNFDAHPITKDITKKFDENAIKASVRNLILTANYERPFHSEIGSQLRAVLFEPFSPMTGLVLRRTIRDVLQNFEPRVDVINVEVDASPDDNYLGVLITFMIKNTSSPLSVSLMLRRTR